MTGATLTAGAVGMSRARRLIGIAFAVFAAFFLLSYGWGAWNPERYVFLMTWFGNPYTGQFLFLVCLTVAVWLLLPVTSEAAQGRRNATRWTFVVISVISLIVFLFTVETSWFAYRGTVLSRAPDRGLSLALIDRGTYGREVHMWSANGMATRDLGSFGRVCGTQISARFTQPGQVLVSTLYGDFHLRTDAAGHPTSFIGPTCSG